SLPGGGSVIFHVSLVAGSRKIQRAAGCHRIDGPGNEAVLERRLVGIPDVVHDDVTAITAKVENVLRETGLAVYRGGEVQLRSGRQVMDDLQHGRSFTRAAPRLSRQHLHVPQITRVLRTGQIIYAVGQYSHLNALPRHAER